MKLSIPSISFGAPLLIPFLLLASLLLSVDLHAQDFDGDGVMDVSDLDDDNDGILDII